MAGRGLDAYEEQAKAAAERGGDYKTNILMFKGGESAYCRFRGLLFPPAVQYDDIEQLRSFDVDTLSWISESIGVWTGFEEHEKWLNAIVRRYAQTEPFIYDDHYIARNKGADSHLTCGATWLETLDCVGCFAKDSGDRGVSVRTQAAFSVIPRRWYHSVENSRTKKKDFAYCAAMVEEGAFCAYCKAGHQPKYEGMKWLPLAMSHTAGLIACARRLLEKCARCQGMGKIRSLGYTCASCQGELVINKDEAHKPVQCNCGYEGRAVESISCSRGCEDPRRAQLFDTDVLVQRIGEKKKTSYQFTESYPFEPLPEELMRIPGPRFDNELKPPSTTQQARQLGFHEDPFTGRAAGNDPRGAGGHAQSYEVDDTDMPPPGPDQDDDANLDDVSY